MYKGYFKLKENETKYRGDSYYDNLASDSDAMREIELFTDNDGSLYKQSFLPIVANIQKKIKSGKYDHSQAPKLWLYHVERALKGYAKEFGEDWKTLLNPKDRKVLAQKYADYVYDDIVQGQYD